MSDVFPYKTVRKLLMPQKIWKLSTIKQIIHGNVL